MAAASAESGEEMCYDVSVKEWDLEDDNSDIEDNVLFSAADG